MNEMARTPLPEVLLPINLILEKLPGGLSG